MKDSLGFSYIISDNMGVVVTSKEMFIKTGLGKTVRVVQSSPFTKIIFIYKSNQT